MLATELIMMIYLKIMLYAFGSWSIFLCLNFFIYKIRAPISQRYCEDKINSGYEDI